MGEFDRKPRAGLPARWQEMFIARGCVDLVRLGNGWTVWKPPDLGRAVSEGALPEHLRQRPEQTS